jgi:3',5'-cyclic AMP phosphodiesterase CpdA
MDHTRRRILRLGSLALLGSMGSTIWGCGSGALKGELLHAPAQGGARPPAVPVKFIQRNDLGAVPSQESFLGFHGRLVSFAQLSDIHITLDEFSFTGYPDLEAMLDGFGDAIGFGGLDRSKTQEHFDVDVLRSMVKTLNAAKSTIDFVINTGDSLDIGTMPELISFLTEMNNLDIPWFQTIGNHDRLGLGNIPPGLLDAFSELDFVDKKSFIEKHFPGIGDPGTEAYGSRAKGFDFSPGFKGFAASSRGYYAFTALPPIHGGPGKVLRPGIRFYVLNSSRRAGSAMGRLGSEQLGWLADELKTHAADLAIVVSHHPVQAIREGGSDLVRILHRHPQVIALLCGHEHTHRIQAFSQPGNPALGFWQIQNASLIDFPQQSRIIEIHSNKDGLGLIRTFVCNQNAKGELGKNARLSYAAAKLDVFDGSGSAEDRDVDLLFQMPAPLSDHFGRKSSTGA